MSDPNDRRTGRERTGLTRVRASVSGLLQRAADAATSGDVARRLRDPAWRTAAALEVVHAGLRGVVQATASRMLELDDAAAELALLVERAADQHGRDRITSHVLRLNPFLDGSIVGLIEPLLAGRTDALRDPASTARARASLLGFVCAIVSLDDDSLPPASADARVAWLREKDTFALYPALGAALEEPGGDAALRLVLGTYPLFLQTFLLRASVDMLPRVAQDLRDASEDAARVIDIPPTDRPRSP